MKFNEKLIELRKKEGLSQEELGYKLDVTRQTVSKWELGQTTPEMDKLVEISKIFNISVDELIKETETTTQENQIGPIQDQPIGEKKIKNKAIIFILVIALIIIVGYLGLKLFTGFLFNKAGDAVETARKQGVDMVFDLFNKGINAVKDAQEQTGNQGVDLFKNTSDQIFNQIEDTYNKNYEEYKEYESEVNSQIDDVFNRVFSDIEDSKKETNDTKKQMEIDNFNSQIELYSGTAPKVFAETVLDNIVTSNKKNDRKISVKYNKTKTKDATEIKNIKKKIHNMSDFVSFDISCEYDKDGYIYEVIIEKM